MFSSHLNHGGLAPDGPFEFSLSGESPFYKILDFTRLVGEFTLLDPDTNNPIEKAVDVSFVNNLDIHGYSTS